MKILITGGSGLLGQYLNLSLSSENQILSLYNSFPGNCPQFNSARVNLTDHERLKSIFLDFKPNTVIHTAAISRPETCDELPEHFVVDVNVNATKRIAELCMIHNAKLIYTSTDLVYNGDRGMMLVENAELNPISLYAETKLQAENEIKRTFDNYIILRTSLLYGIGLNHSVNNFHNMYFSFKNKKSVKLFYDQFRTPLSLLDAARLINELTSIDVKNIVINFGGTRRVSRVELGEILCDLGKFDRSLIMETSMQSAPLLHKVADVSMDTTLLQSIGLKQQTIEESISEILKSL